MDITHTIECSMNQDEFGINWYYEVGMNGGMNGGMNSDDVTLREKVDQSWDLNKSIQSCSWDIPDDNKLLKQIQQKHGGPSSKDVNAALSYLVGSGAGLLGDINEATEKVEHSWDINRDNIENTSSILHVFLSDQQTDQELDEAALIQQKHGRATAMSCKALSLSHLTEPPAPKLPERKSKRRKKTMVKGTCTFPCPECGKIFRSEGKYLAKHLVKCLAKNTAPVLKKKTDLLIMNQSSIFVPRK
jgi:hypothetical protein